MLRHKQGFTIILNREYSPELAQKAAALREGILIDPVGVYDVPSVHHQFASLHHGRKLDMDKIKTGSDFFWQWIDTYAQWVNEMYAEKKPDVLLGMANGANRLSLAMAASVGAVGLETYKKDPKTVGLTDESRSALQKIALHNEGTLFVLEIEDTGTTGQTTFSPVAELRELGVTRIEAAHTWIRNPKLSMLEAHDIPYGAVIHEPLPTYTETECRTLPEGFCNQGVLLIPHGQ